MVERKLRPAPSTLHLLPSRKPARAGSSASAKLFVLDTNVLMHDPTSLFRFEEHDIYLPMLTLEELDAHKKGMTEVARNREQNFALNLLMNPEVDFVTLLGQAGTGKTLLTLAAGLMLTLEFKVYSEIIMTRVTVPVGEDIGFLPGTEEEKMNPWMGALEDNLDVLNKTDDESGDWGRAATRDLIRSRIKVKSLNFMRGRTFINKFLIIDEAQNLTPKQMKTLITRAGPGTKVVCLGNIAQIDTPYLTEGSSGLTYVVDRFKGWSHSGHVTLQRGERSRLADHAAEVL
jgi:PhoH-like ATPase